MTKRERERERERERGGGKDILLKKRENWLKNTHKKNITYDI